MCRLGADLSVAAGAFVVGFAAGGGATTLARLTGQWLSERLGQPFVIENRPGAGRISPPRPSCKRLRTATRCSWSPGECDQRDALPKLSFDFSRDIAPVAGIIRVPNVMVVHPSVPVKTVPELIAYAKANPGKLNLRQAASERRVIWLASCSR